jgi:hypothetical protein
MQNFLSSRSLMLIAVLGLCLTGCAQVGWPPSQNASTFNPPANNYYAGMGMSDPLLARDGMTQQNFATQAFPIVPPIPGVSTGTEVGQKVEQIRNDLMNLQSNVQANSERFRNLKLQTEFLSQGYHGLVAAISARLQVGTTPGNPILIQQWNEAQAQLDKVNENISLLNNVATMTAANSSVANFMLESVKSTYNVSGAIDEDHRQLRVLEDDINRTIVMIERLLRELSGDVSRQVAYVNAERSNLTTMSLAIKNGELYGMSLGNRAFYSQPPAPILPPMGGAAGRPFDLMPPVAARVAVPELAGLPLITIRFDKPVVNYERELYAALSQALERKPDAQFQLIAVSPARGNSAFQALSSGNARKQADQVLRSLSDMGLRGDRVSLSMRSADGIDANEVQVFVR